MKFRYYFEFGGWFFGFTEDLIGGFNAFGVALLPPVLRNVKVSQAPNSPSYYLFESGGDKHVRFFIPPCSRNCRLRFQVSESKNANLTLLKYKNTACYLGFITFDDDDAYIDVDVFGCDKYRFTLRLTPNEIYKYEKQ